MTVTRHLIIGFRLFIIFSTIDFLDSTIEVLFSPDDNPREQIIKNINQARVRIYAAVFVMTDKKIADSLVSAKKRGMDVQIILDQTCIRSSGNKIEFLKDNGIDVLIFAPKSKTNSFNAVTFSDVPIMHNKFIIIDGNVLSGSMNFTRSGSEKNHENINLFMNESEVCDRYCRQFEILKQRCANPNYIKPKTVRKPRRKIRRSKRSQRLQTRKILEDVKKKLNLKDFRENKLRGKLNLIYPAEKKNSANIER